MKTDKPSLSVSVPKTCYRGLLAYSYIKNCSNEKYGTVFNALRREIDLLFSLQAVSFYSYTILYFSISICYLTCLHKPYQSSII